ncbi:MAG: hypothetical protein ACO1SV_05070 [Fimbriimonas sp.]
MKQQVQTPLIVVIVIGVLAVFVWFGMKAMSAGDLDQGQVKYTPGKPPWQETDPAKKGPGGAPGGGGPGVPAGGPPGMAAPVVGNGK